MKKLIVGLVGLTGLVATAYFTPAIAQSIAGQMTYVETRNNSIRLVHDNDLDSGDGDQEIVEFKRSTAVFDSSIGVEMATPVAALDKARFCGNGPNATTATYVGPVQLDDTEADLSYGGAGCDALDNTTEATADETIDVGPFAYKPVAMVCVSDCGTDDTMTLQLRDDTADVSGMTCDITLTGSAAQCTVRDSTPETVAASSAVAVEVVNSDDDDCSSGDVECAVYYTY